ncbi:parapinopsin-like [Engraulis encrasicolus]|uniref:parapinopsin-like n=1 Tax=Engraulis encrasicolus TaxID=184585 RepID=UPI002FCE6A66
MPQCPSSSEPGRMNSTMVEAGSPNPNVTPAATAATGMMDLWTPQQAPLTPDMASPTIFPRVGYSIISYLMFINTLLSVFNNTLVIATLARNPQLLNAMNVIIMSLAVSDLMIACCGSAIVTLTNYKGYFFLGKEFCIFQGFAVNYFGLVSLCTLTLLSYERYRVVCKPMAGFKLTMRRSSQGLLCVWLFCLFWAVMPLLGWSSYGPEGVQTSCSLGWEERSWSNYSYLIFYTILCFLVPTTIIIYCYAKVLISMKKLNRSVELQGGSSSLVENERASRMVLSMIVTFFLCWLPYTALSVVVVVNPELHIPPLLATMPMYFAKTSPVYNPLIYFLSNKQFRECALEVVSCGRYIPHGTGVPSSLLMAPILHRSIRLTSTPRQSRIAPV